MKKTKWLCTLLIYNIDNENSITAGSLAIDKNLWIGSLKYVDLEVKNVQVLIVVVQKKPNNINAVETIIYEKIDGQHHFNKLEHTISNNLVLVDYDATVKLFKFIKSKYISEKKIFITLGHGSVFGINYYDLTIPKLINDNYEKKKITINQLDEYFGNIGKNVLKKGFLKNIKSINYSYNYEETSLIEIKNDKLKKKYQLSNKELSKAFEVFEKNEEGNYVDILVLNNCFMQNIFAQFDFCNTVDYYVAPISGISYPGYNFLEILKNINTNPDQTTEIVANSFVSKTLIENHALYKKPGPNNLTKYAIDKRWFLQSIKLDKEIYYEFKIEFTKYINEMYHLVNSSQLFIIFVKDTFYNCYKYSEKSSGNLDLIDFQTFVISLNDYLARNNNSRILNLENFYAVSGNLKRIFNVIQFSNYCGKDFLTNWENFNDKYLAATKEEAVKKIGLGFYLSKDISADSPLNALLNSTNPYKPSLIEGTKYFELIKLLANYL